MSSGLPVERHPPDAKAVTKRTFILRELLLKGMLTPPPEFLEQWMAKWEEHERDKFIAEMKAKYAKRIQMLRDGRLWDEMEARERDFMDAGPSEITTQQHLDANWLSESLVCLLWALGYISEIPPYDHEVSTEIMHLFPKRPAQPPTLRPAGVIERQRDIAETWHWRARTRQLQESGRMPAVLSAGLTVEQMLRMTSEMAAKAGDFPAPIDGDFPAYGKPYRELLSEEFSKATFHRHGAPSRPQLALRIFPG
jgi:hypothetical protein